ncbi:TonB family protein [Sphingomonas sp.]|uniref:TonB family protein n=1 Tax=Sphingomonas sp. TaxID=28214 RepID=UPI0025D3133B|nr:TonB family protein [Sphingomonas sp.]MBV9528399.1 TonB family protein [Sphingomonas sp.]
MPAPAPVRPRERLVALTAVALVQGGLVLALISGFRVDVQRTRDSVERVIDMTLPKPPPPQTPPPPRKPVVHHAESAPRAAPAAPRGGPGPKPAPVHPAPQPIVAVKPSAPASGGGNGVGPALGTGAGGGTGGSGNGAGEGGGGTDLEQIAGEITSRDYPRDLRDAGVGGRVSFTFTVEPTGRVGRCTVTRSSGAAELDALTCRLVQQRFVYRPSTDRFGRPIADEVDGDHDWIAGGR